MTRTQHHLPSLPQNLVEAAVRAALDEDLGLAGDITTNATVAPDAAADAVIAARKPGVVAGLALAEGAFRAIGPKTHFSIEIDDGEAVKPGAVIARISEARGRYLRLSASPSTFSAVCRVSQR